MTKKILVVNIVNSNDYELYNKGLNGDTQFHKGDSGVDLYTPHDLVIYPGETKFVDLGIQTEVKEYNDSDSLNRCLSYYLYPRSSISKTPLVLANSVGIIDAGYRGNLKAAVKYVPTFEDMKKILSVGSTENLDPYVIKRGTRLFQICSNDLTPFDAVVFSDQLTETTRGEGGFGSTGI